MSWKSALKKVLKNTHNRLEKERVDWAVAGSVATALQGCEVSPRDIDIMSRDPDGVYLFAELLSAFAAKKCEVKSPELGPWRSTRKVPVFVGSFWGLDWHSATYEIDGFEVLIVHVVAPSGHPQFVNTGGVWECDPKVWPYVKRVPFAGYMVPVIPLEIQLETVMTRKAGQQGDVTRLQKRFEQIKNVFIEQGYDKKLLKWSLRRKHLEELEMSRASSTELV